MALPIVYNNITFLVNLKSQAYLLVDAFQLQLLLCGKVYFLH
jgi:hypothetical protein